MLNKSKQQGRTLPKIQSQKRVHTGLEKKDSVRQPLQAKNPSNNRQLKRTLSATNTCKAIRYENTGIIYAKKIQQLQKKSSLLDKQMAKVQQQITDAKKMSSKVSKIQTQKDTFITQASIQSDSKISAKSVANITDQKQLANQIKRAQNKITVGRKKIDQQLQKNNKTRKQIDNVRKQINTLKNLNKSLQINLQKTTQQYQLFNSMSKQLDKQISTKNQVMHDVKMKRQHKKTQIVKNYDQILKYLQRELDKQKKDKNRNKSQSQNDNQVLYFTQFMSTRDQNRKQNSNLSNNMVNNFVNDRVVRQSLRKSKININSQITLIRSKLQNIQKQFEQVKTQMGTKTADQAIKQFYRKYDQNFNFYKYTNQLYKELQQQTRLNKQLQATKDRLFEQATVKNSQIKNEEIQKIKISLQVVRKQKNRHSAFCEKYQQIHEEIKSCIKEYCTKLQIKQLNINNLSEENIIKFLYTIKNKCQRLDNKYQQDSFQCNNEKEGAPELELSQMLQMIKKQNNSQTSQMKSQRLMSRQQFIKAKESIVRKKPTLRKPSLNKK